MTARSPSAGESPASHVDSPNACALACCAKVLCYDAVGRRVAFRCVGRHTAFFLFFVRCQPVFDDERDSFDVDVCVKRIFALKSIFCRVNSFVKHRALGNSNQNLITPGKMAQKYHHLISGSRSST